MATTFGLRGANSTCFQQTGGNETIANATLVTSQPAGQLITFLSDTYTDAAAAETAFRTLGGSIVVRATAGTDPVQATFAWAATTSTPSLVIAQAAADNVFEVKVQCGHSVVN
jgi:hypothetical protein